MILWIQIPVKNENVHDDSISSVGDDNCSGKNTDSDNKIIDLDVCEKIEETRV